MFSFLTDAGDSQATGNCPFLLLFLSLLDLLGTLLLSLSLNIVNFYPVKIAFV